MGERKPLKRLSPRDEEIIYGPVSSRRLGNSLGINVNLRRGKTCNFDCVYCQYGRTSNLVSMPEELTDWLDQNTILDEVESWLRRLNADGQKLNFLTFSGYGEPTLYPRLKETILCLKKLRDDYYPRAKLSILTNSSLITNERVFNALEELDLVIAKLDAGRQVTFDAVNRPVIGVPSFDDIIESLIKLQDETGKVILQTLLFKSTSQFNRDNSGQDEVELIAEKARLIDPIEIQVYTVSRYPSEPFVQPVEESYLQDAVSSLNRSLGRNCAKMYI